VSVCIANSRGHIDSTAILNPLTASEQPCATLSCMDIHEIRTSKLKELLANYRNQKEFADAAGLVSPHVSQMVNGHRQMGEAVARRIEINLKLPIGFMDGDQFDRGLAGATSGLNMSMKNIKALIQNPPSGLRESINLAHNVKRETEDSIVQEICDNLVAAGIDYGRIRDRVSVMTSHGRDSFDVEITGNQTIYCDVYTTVEDSKRFTQQIISMLIAQAGRARISDARYLAIFVAEEPAQQLIGACLDLIKLELLTDYLVIHPTHYNRTAVEQFFLQHIT
jgi:hypothetical protein